MYLIKLIPILISLTLTIIQLEKALKDKDIHKIIIHCTLVIATLLFYIYYEIIKLTSLI